KTGETKIIMGNSSITFAILDDNEEQLISLQQILREKLFCEVLFVAHDSDQFLNSLRDHDSEVDAVILDINLAHDKRNGLEIAKISKRPTLFVSGFTTYQLSQIEDLNSEFDFPVAHLSKPYSDEKLKGILEKFIKEVQNFKAATMGPKIILRLKNEEEGVFNINNIVFIESIKQPRLNKRIYFDNRKPGELVRVNFDQLMALKMSEPQFFEISRFALVNRNRENGADSSAPFFFKILNIEVFGIYFYL
ncbi:MAG: response regulator, partial [Flavobacteriales bacterium]|nr:response regulator [Flavobacteriales bacterium]